MARVLVTEKIAQSGLDLLAEAGHEVDVREGLSPEQLLEAIVGAHALIIRSATKVTAEVLAAGSSLQVVGRAGVGLDNVDVAAATERGVMVVNAPTSNILSVAEQAMALLLAQARNIPQAHAALVAGPLGALEVGGRRAARQGARRRRARAGRLAGGPAGPRLRDGAHRLRPVRVPGAGTGHGGAPGQHRGAGGGGRLRLHPHAQDARDRRPLRTRPAGQGQAGHPHRQHGARRHRRRGGARRRHPRRHRGRRGTRRVRQGALHRVAALRTARRRGLAASRRVHRGGAGQGGGDDRRAGAARAGRRLRALRRQRGGDATSRTPCGPSWGWPSSSGGSSSGSTTGCPTRSTSSTRASWRGRAPASSRSRS